jgi:hypothetical protein
VNVSGPRPAFRLSRPAHELAHAHAPATATRQPRFDLASGPEFPDKPYLVPTEEQRAQRSDERKGFGLRCIQPFPLSSASVASVSL